MISQGTRAELLWIVTGQSLVLLLGMLTLKLLTYLLGPEEYGRFALGLTIAGTLNLFVYGPLGHAVARYYHVCTSRGDLANMMLLSKRLLQGIALGILFIGAVLTFWSNAQQVWGYLIIAALGYGLANGTLSVWLAEINTRRARRRYSLLQSADALFRLAGSVVLVTLLGVFGSVALSGFLLGALVSLFLAWWLDRKSKVPNIEIAPHPSSGTLAREFSTYAGSISLFAIPAIFSSYGDRWIIQQVLSESHVGIYVALAQIANAPANLILAIFSQTINPILFQLAGDATDKQAIHTSRRMLYRAIFKLVGLLALMTIVSYALGEWIVIALTSSEFVPYARLLWVLVLAAAIFQIGQALAAEAFLYNHPFQLFLPKLLHAMVFLGLSLWLVQARQLEGVAIAAGVAAAIYLPLVLIANSRAANTRTIAENNGSPEILR